MKRLPKSDIDANENQELSEMRLLRAVLKLAILDYLSNRKGETTTSSNASIDQKQAFKWLLLDPIGPNSPPFSFGWICQHLSSDYLNLANKIRAAIMTLKSQNKTIPTFQNYSKQDQVKSKAA